MTDLRTRDEVAPSPRARRGAHRAAPSRLAVLLPVLAVVAVVGLAVLALVLFTGLGGRGAADERATASASAPATTPAPTTSAPPPTTPSATSPSPTSTGPSDGAGQTSGTPDGQGSSTSSPGVDERGADDGSAPPPGGQGDDARGAPVVVLNATRTSGLAGRTAETLEGEGWTISRTGDGDKGSVEATQVRYSDPALEGAAQSVAASLDGAAVEQDPGAEKGVVTVVAGPDRVGR